MASIKDTYAFLLDENVQGLSEFFPRARCKSVDDYDAFGAADDAIVRIAGDEGLIIVTNNTRDYTRAMRKVTQMGDRRRHVNGLLTLGADTMARQRDLLPLEKLESKMRLNDYSITWPMVAYCNLWVHVMSKRNIRVSRLPPCSCLDQDERGKLDGALGRVTNP